MTRTRLVWIALAMAATVWTGPRALADCRPGDFVVAVDAGHGPRRPGATSASGAAEYAFNIRLAGKVVAALAAAGFPRAFLVDPEGRDLPPAERARRANAAGAGLLVSIHHDSVQPRFLEAATAADGGQRRFCDRYSGYSLFYSGRNRHAAASLDVARRIAAALRAAGLSFTRHHAADIPGERRELVDDTVGVYRYDGLAVLHAADMPAALLEAGVIVNRAEEAALAGDGRQRLTARAVAAAVAGWCAGKRP